MKLYSRKPHPFIVFVFLFPFAIWCTKKEQVEYLDNSMHQNDWMTLIDVYINHFIEENASKPEGLFDNNKFDGLTIEVNSPRAVYNSVYSCTVHCMKNKIKDDIFWTMWSRDQQMNFYLHLRIKKKLNGKISRIYRFHFVIYFQCFFFILTKFIKIMGLFIFAVVQKIYSTWCGETYLHTRAI